MGWFNHQLEESDGGDCYWDEAYFDEPAYFSKGWVNHQPENQSQIFA